MKHSAKKKTTRFLSLFLAAAMSASLAACQKNNPDPEKPVSSSDARKPAAAMGDVSTRQLSADVKEKYQDEAQYIYKEPGLNQDKEVVLYADLDFDPQEKGITDLNEIADVYIDSEFTTSVRPNVSYDKASSQLLLEPPSSPVLVDYFENLDNPETGWGRANIYYLVMYYDKDGTKLEKPEVTMFTIKNEVEAPFIEYKKAENGYASYRWTDIADADHYILYGVSLAGDHVSTELIAEPVENSFVHETGDFFNLGVISAINYLYASEGSLTYSYDYICVAASKDGKVSQVSNMLDVDKFRSELGWRVATEDGYNENLYAALTVAEMASYATVEMCDGSFVNFTVSYDLDNMEYTTVGEYLFDLEGIDPEVLDRKLCTIPFMIDGMNDITGICAIKECDFDGFEDILRGTLKQREEMKAKPGITNEVSISIGEDDTPAGQDDTSASESSQAQSATSQDEESSSMASSQGGESNSATSQSGNSRTVEIENANVYANSAMSEYIALHLVNGEEYIDISEFHESKDSNLVLDALLEAYYQNPLSLGIDGVATNQDNTVVKVTYTYGKEEQKKKQAELRAEVSRVVDEIITDGMTDLEKELAINNYLCDTAEYDTAALEYALEHDMQVDPSFDDSFSAYGVLINKVGVCASYSAAFKLLADEAGLDCIVVTGYLNGNLPHAWNRVLIDGQWMSIDATNNDTPELYNWLVNLPDTAAGTVLVEDANYVLDSHLDKFSGEKEDVEYYRISNLYYSKNEIAKELAKGLEKDGEITLRTDYFLSDEEIRTILGELMTDPSMEKHRSKFENGKALFTYNLGVFYITFVD